MSTTDVNEQAVIPAAERVANAQDASATNWAEGTAASASGGGESATEDGEGGNPPPAWANSLPALSPAADLPIANISRIMKRVLPENGKIAKNAKECMQECVNELISFITSEASDRCGSEKRKTINGDDILYSLRVLGFDNYEQVLKVYLSRYRQAQEENPRQRRRRTNKRNSSITSISVSGEAGVLADEHDDDENAVTDEDDDE
ncbi:transcriptional activator hap3 [Malassezia cuniculi]|uniref:Transcriptional activator hap3 n=1 Tax=Malassezia cuniculi TaxID=948313 RepID=A0AAF0EYM3_9BASI|nr:transcriptional activator hap3 [Malassezia cuniculi]